MLTVRNILRLIDVSQKFYFWVNLICVTKNLGLKKYVYGGWFLLKEKGKKNVLILIVCKSLRTY